ncbi:tRNA epoxyqueuosine(34) reductase QueG [Candidatus Kapabacteria bacterium]|nr:tRNA epoxyqueuosine(34) reductase QueG [Candidatus Kapabacteria bacterium]
MKSNIIDLAKSLGFSEIKFAKYQKLEQQTKNLKKWIDNDFHADMDWIKNHLPLRDDPSLLLENCKTVIVFAHSYNNGIDHLPVEGYGKIARYAMGRDYHKVLKNKLKKISKYLESKKIKTKYFVDSGPIAERDWAVISGIGARAKNSLILNKKLGSFFFLSTMLVDQEIEADSPVLDMCGKCTKCIKACPTGAITEPYIVDSRKCISYWTIEYRGETLPKNITENQNKWIFGCDICQEVCPWNNHKNILNTEKEFYPRDNTTQLDLLESSEISEKEFIDRFAGQPIIRTKFSGLKRNAKSALNFVI